MVDASLSPQPPLPPPRRGPIRDSERTRAAILAAATEEFARHGLGGARVERIAVRARTNKRMLYYYFRSKDDLFLAELSLLDVPPEEGVRRLVRFTWEYYLANPEFLTLLHTENLHGASHVKRSSAARALNSPLIETLERVLQRGVAEGVFRDDVDALQLYISIAGLAYFYLGNNHTLSAVFGRDLARPGARRERLAHMVDVITGYLRPLPAPVDGEAAPRR